jgi:C4-dicarboxylate-specific signal transduction histidine kinase
MAKAAQEAVDEVKELGGRAISFVADDLSAGQSEALMDAFNSVRREEYAELLQRCMRFQDHVQRLIDAKEFKFGAVEEIEEDLEKRRRSFAQIVTRDVFEVAERRETEAGIKDCEAALARFVELAFLASKTA